MSKINDKISFIFSAIFSPFLVIPVFSLVSIWYYSPALSSFLILSVIFIGFSVVLPFLYIALAVKFGLITDVHVALREQRETPFKLALIGSLIVFLTYYLLHTSTALLAMALALLVNGLIFIFLTKFWKVSMHAASFASAVTLAGILINSSIYWLYLLLIPIFWSRLYRKKHSIGQLVAASVISVAITATVLLLFK